MENNIPTGKWYQEAVINGVTMPTIRNRDTNEKRWKNLIEPLLPKTGGLFIELGSNAGFYLRKAKTHRYEAIGVELSKEYVAHAKYWEENDPKDVKTIEGDLNEYDIPATQVVLLANIIYWLTPKEIKKLVNKLNERTLYVIVIGRQKESSTHLSSCRFEKIKEEFKDWEICQKIDYEKHFSVLFKNSFLCEKEVDKLFNNRIFLKSKKFISSYTELIDLVLSKKIFDKYETKYYKYLKWRKFEKIDELLEKHIELIKDVNINGIKEPLLLGRIVNKKYKKQYLSDGDHRLIIAKYLGTNKVICKILQNGN